MYRSVHSTHLLRLDLNGPETEHCLSLSLMRTHFIVRQCFEGPYCLIEPKTKKCKQFPKAVSKCDDAVGPDKPYVFGS